MLEEINAFVQELEEGTRLKMDEYPSRESAFTAHVLEEISEKIGINEYHIENLSIHNNANANLGEISGYAYSENGETLSLFYTLYDSASDGKAKAIKAGDYQQAITRMQSFYNAAIRGLHLGMKKESPLCRALKDIYDHHHQIVSVYLRVVSNSLISNSDIKNRKIDDKTLYADVWDIKKIYANLHSGLDHVAININFEDEDYNNFEIPYIEMDSNVNGYKCLLAMFPGKLLYKLYERHNVGLLLNNVRYFLGFKGSSRSNANIGMLATLKKESEMFLAYNNGITAIAANILPKEEDKRELRMGGDPSAALKRTISMGILQTIYDFRIVNGGQTTATLFMSKFTDKEKKINLDNVFVQVKIIILNNSADDKVANVTKFSNSQTKIKYADFTISNPYNQTMEKLSRTMCVPNGNNSPKYWFYERVRGQYDAEKAKYKTKPEQLYFASLYPKEMKFKKELIAKVWNSWIQTPNFACQGESISYDKFITKQVNEGYIPDEKHFRQTVALLMIYQYLDSYARERKYGSCKNAIISYVLAYVNYVTFNRLDLQKIWDNQSLSVGMQNYLSKLSDWMYRAFSELSGDEGVVKFCKQPGAFDKIKKYGINVPISLIDADLIK